MWCSWPGPAKPFETYRSQFFDEFDDLAVLAIPSDAQISRSGDFRADNDNNRHTN